jgi:hypothetical protein
MAFAVEDGFGVVGANSYCSVDHADDYHAERDNTVWDDSSTAEKQQALVIATQYVDRVFGYRFRGAKKLARQALEHPRDHVFDDFGNTIGVFDLEATAVSAGSDTLTVEDHGLVAGEPVQVSTDDTLPGGLSEDVTYYTLVTDADTLQLAATSGGSAIDLTSAGAGTTTIHGGRIPIVLREATAEYAVRSRSKTILPDVGRDTVSESKSVDGIAYSKNYGSPGGGLPRYPEADRLLSGLLVPPMAMRA